MNNLYFENNDIHIEHLDDGITWMDMGSFDSYLDASMYIASLEKEKDIKSIIQRSKKLDKNNFYLNNLKINEDNRGFFFESFFRKKISMMLTLFKTIFHIQKEELLEVCITNFIHLKQNLLQLLKEKFLM